MVRISSAVVTALFLAGCANVGTQADFPDMPDAVPSGPGALSGAHGEFVLYSTTGSDSGKRRAGAIGDAQSRYGSVVSPETQQPPPEEAEADTDPENKKSE